MKKETENLLKQGKQGKVIGFSEVNKPQTKGNIENKTSSADEKRGEERNF